MAVWEYAVICHAAQSLRPWEWDDEGLEGKTTEEVLNEYGAHGRELVAVVPRSEPSDDDRSGCTTAIDYFFKHTLV